jgi:flagellar FliL protein
LAEERAAAEAAPRKKSRLLVVALPLALLLGGGSFYAVYAGLIPLPFLEGAAAPEHAETTEPFGPDRAGAAHAQPAFVSLEPLVISLGPGAEARHLKLKVQVETSPDAESEVAALRPRIADVLNTLLRAVEESDVAEPHAMLRLRAQMLRRVRLVTPPGAVRDLLIEQFVLN